MFGSLIQVTTRPTRNRITAKAPKRAHRRSNPNLETLDGRLLLSAAPIMIQPPPETDYFEVTGVPSQVTAGTPFTITVTEYAYSTGKVVNDNGLEVSVAANVGGTDTSLGSVALNGGKASVTLTKAEEVDGLFVTYGSISNPKTYITGYSSSILVNDAAPVKLFPSVSNSTQNAGTPFGVTIDGEDRYGNLFIYDGNVTITASDGQKVTTTGAVVEGEAIVTLNEPDIVTLTVTAGSATGTTGSIFVDAPTATSTVWSGYAATTGPGVAAVGGSWVQPSASGANGSESSIWVGIDGNGQNGTVEQCGTATTIVNGAPQIVAWYEFFGDQSSSGARGHDYLQQNVINVDPSFVVHAGDTISAEVSLVPGTANSFLFQMTDKPKSGGALETFSLVQTTQYVTPQRSSAEWIAENPNKAGQPLADFGQVTFNGAWATVGSTTTPINKLANLRALNMVATSGNSTLAVATNPPATSNTLGYNEPSSGLQSSSFSITFLSPGPRATLAEPQPGEISSPALFGLTTAFDQEESSITGSLFPSDDLGALDAALEDWNLRIAQDDDSNDLIG